ncbi:uncharacterized protein JCM10292_001123 [Rhodotorula paludigena]|uniref:uncharacterized protein n=1 Tax=Rhodotorula paludigena TaxID=86838 RepID=UPI00316C2B62
MLLHMPLCCSIGGLLLLLAVIADALVLPQTSGRLLPRQASSSSSSLGIWLDEGPAYRENGAYWCDKQVGYVLGAATPLSLAAIRFPFPANVSEQTVLAHIGHHKDTAKGKRIKWQVKTEVGEQYVWRVIDALGNIRYSHMTAAFAPSDQDDTCSSKALAIGLGVAFGLLYIAIIGWYAYPSLSKLCGKSVAPAPAPACADAVPLETLQSRDDIASQATSSTAFLRNGSYGIWRN